MIQKSYDDKPKIFLVPTPIGNILDITLRSLNVLKEVSRIYAEDTRNSAKLLKHYDITTPLFSYHEHNEFIKTKEIIDYLLSTKSDIALISDAGQPIISDPGLELVKEARLHNINVISLPGASAFATAFCASGFSYPFFFIGFLDSKSSKRIQQLNQYKYYKETLIFYESPHRIQDFINDLKNIFINRNICISREISKLYEEYAFYNLGSDISINPKGEYVILVEGYKEMLTISESEAFVLIHNLIKKGSKLTAAVKEIASIYNLDRKILYKNYLTEESHYKIEERGDKIFSV